MAFPTDTFTGAGGDLDVFINEVWGKKINDFAKDKLVAARFFTNRSDELAGGGDTIHTPNITEMSGNDKVNGATVTLNSPTETAVDLVVNTWKEVSFAIEDGEAAIYLKSYYLQELYAKNAAYTASNYLEDAILNLASSFSNSVGSSTYTIVESTIRKAISLVADATKKEPEDGTFGFFFDTQVFWNQVAAIDTFKLNVNTPAADPAMKPPVKYLYSVPVWITSRIPTSSGAKVNFLADKDAIHYALAKLPRQQYEYVRVQSNYVPHYLSTVTTADLKYGVVMNRATYGCKILSQS